MNNNQYESRLQNFFNHRKFDAVLLTMGAILGVIFDWSAVEVVIFLIFLWSLIGPLSSRILIGAVIFFFSFTPVFLVFDNMDRAEEFSVYAYYFLVMAVIRAIIEVRNEKNDEENTEKS